MPENNSFSPENPAKPRVLVIVLGGTITMTKSGIGGVEPSLSGIELLGKQPELQDIAELEVVSPVLVPSATLTINDLIAVADLIQKELAAGIAGAVVVQGTDTIEETSFLLDLLLDATRPVVVTGAMRPAEAAGADGPANLLASIIVAASEKAVGYGTLVVLNDEIHAADAVIKGHTALPSAFQSPLTGPLGLIAEGEVRLYRGGRPGRHPSLSPTKNLEPVALLTISLGDDDRLLRSIPDLGYVGLVIEAMGAGHVPAGLAPQIEVLCKLMPVVLSSRVTTGPIFTRTYGFPGSEIDLISRGLIPGGILTGPKARLLLSLALASGMNKASLVDLFRQYS
ncbi:MULTISPECIES: asparaginase [unclassified Aurantimonas]|uniref:asparaginase n=1 Tax=unclassified Aurantimonas TaxID=2638230 RepID=UPI002E18F08B|nr:MULTISPECIES: asparaginase [unclassified Aurantimonas]MEC5293672.1 asparaginase [Aurantimonas sp. C2-3-R2]MEC5414735.1 asparaginase [Aurantimonas sp. C2-4-R8]